MSRVHSPLMPFKSYDLAILETNVGMPLFRLKEYLVGELVITKVVIFYNFVVIKHECYPRQ